MNKSDRMLKNNVWNDSEKLHSLYRENNERFEIFPKDLIESLCSGYNSLLKSSNNSRELNALVGDSDISGDFDVYYKSIYKGTGSPYGNMSESDAYISLPTEGILLSQELWEIKVILANKVDNPDSTISVSDSSNYPNVSSGDIFLNLNTSTIRIAIGFGECTDYNLSVSVYKFDTQNNSFPHKSNSDIGSE